MKDQTMLAAFLLLLLAVLPLLPSSSASDSALTGERTQRQATLQVVINELAWAGTAASASDEWIELRNNTSREIDLSGWTLVWGEDESPIVIHLGAAEDNTKEIRRTVIPARGFYLLERTDDNTVSDVEADVIYTGALRNGGETLRLFDAEGNIVDTVNPDGGEWPAGTTGDVQEGEVPYASMERIDPTASDADDNWASNDGIIRRGQDEDGEPINGTPKAENSRKKTQ